MTIKLRRFSAFFIAVCMCFSFVACSGPASDQPGTETTVKPEDTAPPPVSEAPETFDIISDGKFLFNVITTDIASVETNRLASLITEHIQNSGIEIPESDKKIIVGTEYSVTKNSPIDDINVAKLGVDGYAIKHEDNTIFVVANNDVSLADGVNFFIENCLTVSDGKATMEEGYRYINSTGIFLSDMKIAGTDIRKFTVTADKDLEETVSYIKELVMDKCGVSLPDSAEKKIVLTADGAVSGTVTAKVENGDLVIRAANLEEMKKAIVCFWFETVAYSLGTYDLPADTSYSKDLSQTVFYSDFNVKQSDSECCLNEINKAHKYANENGLKVFADFGAKYYISTTGLSVNIYTDVEWGNAEFTIDDSNVTHDDDIGTIFYVRKTNSSYEIDTIKTLSRDMTNLGITLPQKSILTFTDDTKIQFIRKGYDQNDGSAKQDRIVVDKDGSIDMDAPIMWDFDNITSISVLPIEDSIRYVSGGKFTTIANQAPSKYPSYKRNLVINRSNTVVNGVEHYITGEGETGAPYTGFFMVSGCAYVNIQNCILTGHKNYDNNGSYDIGMKYTISVTFLNCFQSNDITDGRYWGLSGTNYNKNFIYDRCVISRVDAHAGVTNGTIKDSVIGHGAVRVVGYGTFLIENSSFFSPCLITLRGDFGSTWDGDIICRNSEIIHGDNVTLIDGENVGDHDFGYTCYTPKNIIFDGLRVDTIGNIYIFDDFNEGVVSSKYNPKYPMQFITEKVTIKNYSSTSGKVPELTEPDVLTMNLFSNVDYTVE